MSPTPATIDVAWCPPDRAATARTAPALQRFTIAPCSVEELPHAAAHLAVIDTVAISDLTALRRAYQRLRQPALLIVERAALDAVIGWLRPDDALCLPETPPPLVAHQLRQLFRIRAHALDTLTGLAHRQRLLERLDHVLATASEAHPVSLLMTDVDRFKETNDRHGHQVGDTLLRELAALVQRCTPGAELIARYSGEQFAVLLHAGEDDALAIAERIRHATEERTFTAEVSLTMSLGLATVERSIEPHMLLRRVQEALFAAKAKGRNRVVSHGELERSAVRNNEDLALTNFENLTRVVSDRIVSMITRRGRQIFEEIKQQADVDSLTQLYSRRYLDRRLAHEFDVAAEDRRPLTVALLDIDHFGDVNKQHGWPSGDQVLAELSELVTRNVRASDWVARYGGEELCLVMPDTELAPARTVLERIRNVVERHAFRSTAGESIPLTISLGAAENAVSDEELAGLIERVSAELLRAKRGGRNRVCAAGS